MGQRVLKKSSLISSMEYYPVHGIQEEGYRLASLNGFADEDPRTSFNSPKSGNCHSTCEFKDFCNHLYYADGKCNCASGWRRTTGLVLPTSA